MHDRDDRMAVAGATLERRATLHTQHLALACLSCVVEVIGNLSDESVAKLRGAPPYPIVPSRLPPSRNRVRRSGAHKTTMSRPHPRPRVIILVLALLQLLANGPGRVQCLIPLIDGGRGMPKMYDSYFDEQIAKQANAAISRAISAGTRNMEVQFPPVPNVEEAKFGTPLK